MTKGEIVEGGVYEDYSGYRRRVVRIAEIALGRHTVVWKREAPKDWPYRYKLGLYDFARWAKRRVDTAA